MRKILPLCFVLAAMSARADVLINEISASQTDRLLRWDANNQAYAGAGHPWWSVDFDDSTWQSGATPIGFDLGTIDTNVRNQIRGVTPSLYVRHSFSAAAADASSAGNLALSINCNDGFIVWLNGKELARSNMGAEKAHIYADQLAYREAGNSTTPVNVDLGPASGALVAGDNTLAIQVSNSDINSSLRLEMSLAIGASQLIPSGSTIRFLPGLLEPSSDLSEPADLAAGTSDWIELHNTGASPVDLAGWSLSDDPALPAKWQFPAGTIIEAGGYLLVLADNPASPIPGAHFLHANFKLSGNGDFIGLYDDSGAAQDQLAPQFPRQYPFHSYGIAPGGGPHAYLGLPSPGRENSGPSFSGRADAPDFDIEGGFFDSSITIALSSETPEAEIRYTTDGTEPTPNTGTAYDSPITLARISNKKGHVIRARAFADGMIPSKTKTNTYLIGQDPRLRTAPALVYSADLPRSLYDPYGVLAINGGSYPSSRWQPVDDDDYNNVVNRGRAYERPIHAEYYFTDGSAGFRTDCGVRIAASSYSRPRMTLTSVNSSPWPSNPTQKPSFNLFFRDEYGNPDVSLPLNGENSPVKNFEQFRVRAGKNDIQNPFYIDELVRRMSRDMGQVASKGVINTLYVNGELKGFYNLVERLRTPFFRSYHSSDPNADWDVLQFEGNDNIADGDKVAWDELVSRLNAPTTLENWEDVLEYADPENIADYFLLNIYMATWDWPHNNWVAARERSTEGRYRLYVWDAEGAMNNKGGRGINTDMINRFIIGTQAGSSGSDGKRGELRDLWNGLNRWEEFRILFADRINKHLFNGGVLDDQDYDNSHLKSLNDGLVEEFDDLLSFVSGQSVTSTHARNWATGTTRRDYLLGPARESFRDHELWPSITPPVFSQFGGDVAAGYALNFLNETGSIYYTVDGSDPRLPGGSPNPNAIVQGGSRLERQLIAAGSVWQFNDLGEDLGTAWREPGYDDQTWSEGAAPLGYGSINGFADITPMNTVRNPTAYLRSSFEIDDAPAYTELRIAVHVDGGAVVYINGQEALRDGMPDGPITYNTSSDGDGNEGVFDDYVIDPSFLVTGTNIIAVEVHNVSPGSSDMVIDIALEATRTNPASPPYIVNTPVTVQARSFDGTTWSALTSADFTVETEPASSANLAITEILYNPAGPSAEELAAGFSDGDQFEFLQIQNIGDQAIDLHGVRFTDGITFDYGTSSRRALAPGSRALIVSDLAAFNQRNGSSSIMAGQYSGRLNNGGEQVRLIDAAGETMHEFTYTATTPWPSLDGLDGHSIQIVDPSASHANGANWTASAEVGGQPGGNGFSLWVAANALDPSESGPGDDPDGDGLDNFAEFALGTPPLSGANGIPLPSASIASIGDDRYLVLEFTRQPGERELRFTLESSSDLATWTNSAIEVGTPITNPDGSLTSKLRDLTPFDSATGERRFLRLKISGE